MNWQHLQAFVWLRWRLMVNHWRRAGALNAVLLMIVAIGAMVTAIPVLIGCFLLGTYLIPEASPLHLMYAWDGVIGGFLLFWGIGLVTELQRSDPLALSRFLHLPVSLRAAFLINYFSSLLRLSLIVFGPVMLGFGLALVYVKGIRLLPVLPLLAAFLLMVTALTYQFQGWLGSLMSNPRRRRAMVVATTAGFIMVFQLPNLINFISPWEDRQRSGRFSAFVEEKAKLDRALQSHEIAPPEYVRRQQDVMKEFEARQQQESREIEAFWEKTARVANMVLPIGWLPLGVMSAAEGRGMPWLLGLFGMSLIGTASLWRAYGSTVGQYQGQLTNRKGRPAVAPKTVRTPGRLLVESRLPGVSEPVSVIALGSLRALVRSPEAKMMLLTPLIMSGVFGSMLWRTRHELPEFLRPLIAIGGMLFVLFGILQLMGNQFGFDRDGFRVYVLCPASRQDILVGKNLAFAPIALGMAAVLLAAVQILSPMRLDHFLAMFPQFVSMFLLFCVFANLLSIYAPLYIAAGALKASNPKLSTVLLQLVMFTFFFPLTQGLTLLPLGIEAVLNVQGWTYGIPVGLVLTLAECAAIVLFYRVATGWQGELFQAREQMILERVTNRAP